MDLRVLITLTVDGRPVAQLPLNLHGDVPPVGQVGQLQIVLDGRALAQLLGPHLGPTSGPAAKLWVPGGR
jgi:hypothetical protein